LQYQYKDSQKSYKTKFFRFKLENLDLGQYPRDIFTSSILSDECQNIKSDYLLTKAQNSSGESQIILRTYVRHDYRIRIQSGIWVSPKRWGKKNGITLPTIPGEEQEELSRKKETLKRLTIFIESELARVEDKEAIDRAWGEKKVKAFYKPAKAPKERDKSFFDVIEVLSVGAETIGVPHQ
jgi:hypothetical protein